MYTKPYELQKEHFLQRLKERYDINMTTDEYDSLLCNHTLKFLYSKNSLSSICVLSYNNIQIYCLYNKTGRNLTTVYPSNIYDSDLFFISACFPKSIHSITENIYNKIIENIEQIPSIDLTGKEAWIYYSERSPFANLLMDRREFGKWKPIKMVNTIKRILEGKHPFANIKLELKEKGIN